MTPWADSHIRFHFAGAADDLTFRSYAHQRMMYPQVEPKRWAVLFPNQPEMEEIFQLLLLSAAAEEEIGHA